MVLTAATYRAKKGLLVETHNVNLFSNLITIKTTFVLILLPAKRISLFLSGGRSMSPEKFPLHNVAWRLTACNKIIRVGPSSRSHLGAIRIPWSLHKEVRTHFLSAGEIEWCNFVVCGNLKTLASWPAPKSLPKAFTKSSSTLSNSKWNNRWTLLKRGGCANPLQN